MLKNCFLTIKIPLLKIENCFLTITIVLFALKITFSRVGFHFEAKKNTFSLLGLHFLRLKMLSHNYSSILSISKVPNLFISLSHEYILHGTFICSNKRDKSIFSSITSCNKAASISASLRLHNFP